jgi:hypothetical protein
LTAAATTILIRTPRRDAAQAPGDVALEAV